MHDTHTHVFRFGCGIAPIDGKATIFLHYVVEGDYCALRGRVRPTEQYPTTIIPLN